ncbi:diguanylate cyclase domain-containing protein [Kaarinaea lacus]
MDNTQANLDATLTVEILNKLSDAVLIVDGEGAISWCNQAAPALLGTSAEQIITANAEAMEKSCLHPLADETNTFYISGETEDEPLRWLHRQRLEIASSAASYVVVYKDISSEKRFKAKCTHLQQQLDELSTVDRVSGLLNKRAMLQNLEPLVSRSRRYENPLSVITMEILNADAIKQQHGDAAFDQAVKEVSFLLKDQLRWADLVARSEDNHFVFILPETDKPSAVHLAHKINGNISELRISFESQKLQLQPCFGVAAWEKGNDSMLLLRHAKQSLETAKKDGPGSIQD